MGHWEVLRRSPVALSVKQVAAACRIGHEEAQVSLDRLEQSGFVIKIRATTTTRCPTYRVPAERVIISVDQQSEVERDWSVASRRSFRRARREMVESALASRTMPSAPKRMLDFGASAVLNKAESKEAFEVVAAAIRALEQIENRAYRRRQSGDSDSGGSDDCGYHFTFEMQPLHSQPLPDPRFEVWSERSVQAQLVRAATEPDAILSAKEKIVAKRLVAGESRPKIAMALKLSKHTVATISKRIYSKLRVHSRAELSARMRGA